MPVASLNAIVKPALSEGYGVPAINVVNDLTLEAVLAAAVECRSPLIVQTSVKTVQAMRPDVLFALWRSLTAGIEVPVCLHLDHCPDRAVISECLALGWNSVLFDASSLSVAENTRQTVEVVREARAVGADVEGEIEAITGVEDGIGSDEAAARESLQTSLAFIAETGVSVFAPSIGNAHGQYRAAPVLDGQRVSDLVEATGIPIALHGGTGLTAEQFTDLIARGCAKVNISTALKRSFMQSSLAHLQQAERRDNWEPLSLFRDTATAVREMATRHMQLFGSAGRVV